MDMNNYYFKVQKHLAELSVWIMNLREYVVDRFKIALESVQKKVNSHNQRGLYILIEKIMILVSLDRITMPIVLTSAAGHPLHWDRL